MAIFRISRLNDHRTCHIKETEYNCSNLVCRQYMRRICSVLFICGVQVSFPQSGLFYAATFDLYSNSYKRLSCLHMDCTLP